MKNIESHTLSLSSAIQKGMPVVLLNLLDDYTLLRDHGFRGQALSDELLTIIQKQNSGMSYPNAVQALNDTAKFFKFMLDA